MSLPHELRCQDVVRRPYEAVRAALSADAPGLFARATQAAAGDPPAAAAQLRVALGGLSLATDVDLEVTTAAPVTSPWHPDAVAFGLSWHARRHASLFPAMHAQLAVYPLSPRATRLVFAGAYEPPFGALGEVVDAVLGGRIALACVQRFVAEVAAQLGHELAEAAPCV